MSPTAKFIAQQNIYIAQQNVAHFHQRLATATDDRERQTIRGLLEKERTTLSALVKRRGDVGRA